MEYVLKFFFLLLWQGIVPFGAGILLLHRYKLKKDVVWAYLMGVFMEWALFELIAVGCIRLKTSLTFVTVLWCLVMIVTCIAGFCLFVRKRESEWYQKPVIRFKEDLRKLKAEGKLLAAVTVGLILFQMYMYVFYQHVDADDARYIANAVAAWDSDTMLLTHPNTGEVLTQQLGELEKDAVSPWMIYIAMIAKLTMIHPTILAHTVLPVLLLLTGYCVYWKLGNCLLKNDLKKQICFLGLLSMIHLFGYTSVYSAATFFLTRIWQGKAIVAGVLLPAVVAILLYLQEDQGNYRWYFVLTELNLAACLLSGMGLVFSAVIEGCFIFSYAVQKKSFRDLLYGVLACVPNVVLGVLYIGGI